MSGRPTLDERERQEIAFWSASEQERPGAFGLDLLTHKMSEARIFLEKLDRFALLFDDARTILEIGGGQCWPSVMVKRQFPAAAVIGTDIAPDAVTSAPQWEHVVESHLDGRAACRSHQLPFADGTIDLAFTFAAAHHFGAHRSTLRELARVLRPGGHALYLYEPGVRAFLYKLALKRVMAKRPVVPEDLLRYRELEHLALESGLRCEIQFAPTTTYRGGIETVYYLGLQRIPPLQRILPCTIDVVLTKA